MRVSTFGILAAALFLTGCASVAYISNTYADVTPVNVPTAYDTFTVFDRPNDGKMMVNTSIGAAFVQGATFNVANTPKPIFQEAAERYLAQTGRQCSVTDGYALATVQWEFRYKCEGVSTASIH